MLTIEKIGKIHILFLDKVKVNARMKFIFGTSYLIIDSFEPSEFVNQQKQILTTIA